MRSLGSIALALTCSVAWNVGTTSLIAQQTKESAEQRYERAVLIEEGERDPERALALLAQVSGDAAAKKELRAQAFLRSGRVLRRLGREAEATKQFESAAALEGAAADEAKRILAGTDDEAERVKRQVEAALGQIRRSAPNAPSATTTTSLRGWQAFDNLVWIGDAAVPFIAAELAASDQAEPAVAPVLAMVLVEIGGAPAAVELRRTLANSDPLFQRAVISWLTQSNADTLAREPVRSELLVLLRHRDARIRLSALQQLGKVMTVEELAALLRDESEEVRAAAISAMAARAHESIKSAGGGLPDAAVAALEAAMGDRSLLVRQTAVAVLTNGVALRNDRGRRLFLDCLGRDERFDATIGGFFISAVGGLEDLFVPPLPAEELLQVARRIGPFGNPDEPNLQSPDLKEVFHRLVRACWEKRNQPTVADAWDREQWPSLWELVRLGLGPDLAKWVRARAEPSDAVAIAEAYADYGSLCGELSPYFAAAAPKLSADEKRAVLAAMDRLLRRVIARRARKPGSEGLDLQSVVEVMVTLDTDDADRALLRQAQEAPVVFNAAVPYLLGRARSPAASVLAGFLVTNEELSRNSQELRSRLVLRLVKQRAPELLAAIPTAYELGLALSNPEEGRGDGGRGLTRGITNLLTVQTDPQSPRRFEPLFAAAALVPAFEACAKGNTADFWSDVSTIRDLLAYEPRDPLRDELLLVIRRHVADAPDPRIRDGIIRTYVSRRGPEWEDFAAEHLDDPRLQAVIVAALTSLPESLRARVFALLPTLPADVVATMPFKCAASDDSQVREKTFEFLRHDSEEVRKSALFYVFDAFKERALDATAGLSSDPSSTVRAVLAKLRGETFDRRAIPLLVETLRDPVDAVRAEAKNALEKIQFYVDNKERWQRLLDGAGLDAGSAAEALLKQAAATQPKATRLVAIESLGTLGVAETLPFLIQAMGDGDAQIAAAAKAAIDRVNRRAAHVETPAEKSGN